jgi:hypothetical protein
MNQTVFEGMRAIVHTARLPKQYWGEAVITTDHVYNRIGHQRNAGKSPFDIIMGKPANVSNIRTFGERCWYLVKDRKMMDPKAREAILLGYVPGSSAYRLQDVETKKIVFTRNVRFDGRHPTGQLAGRVKSPKVNAKEILITEVESSNTDTNWDTSENSDDEDSSKSEPNSEVDDPEEKRADQFPLPETLLPVSLELL